ncbi:hypothetical protein [Moraxella sp. ZY200743]|uniref:hypothetical protein n=1 Tax=Moraxella sp. ZY200743 TaxID=2911970 RepID=UPI003D7C38FB
MMKLRNAMFNTMFAVALTTMGISAHAMLPTPKNAQQASDILQIDQRVNAFLVHQDATGKEVLQPLTASDNVARGEIVEYQGLFTNQDTNRVRSMIATLNIPEGVELVGAVEPAIVKASTDGQRFVHMPIRANINGQVRELPLSYYKALRWTVEDLGIGATAVVKYRVRVK